MVQVWRGDYRVAQQLGMLASFPFLGVVVLPAIGVIPPTFTVAVRFAAGLLAIDTLASLPSILVRRPRVFLDRA